MPDQQALNLASQKTGPVECLGQKFPSDEVRREQYLKLLAEKLKDPEFRKIEGFPIGEDEDILALSDPPYYTACPNPWIDEFIKYNGETFNPNDNYNREPFSADVTVARHDHYSLAHTYHTKVSPLAVTQYVEHFTKHNDIVIDFFCGSGMTGLATTGTPSISTATGYKLSAQKPRNAILVDLGIAATHIANGHMHRWEEENYKSVEGLLNDLENKLSHLFQCKGGGFLKREDVWSAKKSDISNDICTIDYLVFSEILICQDCGEEFSFGEMAYDPQKKEVKDNFKCPGCAKELTKRSCARKKESYVDIITGNIAWSPKLKPFLVAYNSKGKRYYRKATTDDIISKIEINKNIIPEAVPIQKGERYHKDALSGIYGVDYIHHFYSSRNLDAMSRILELSHNINEKEASLLRFAFTSIAIKASKLMNWNADGVGRVMKGTLYQSSLIQECNPFWLMRITLKDLRRLSNSLKHNRENGIISTGTATNLNISSNCIDYVWVDPPFGKNLMYAELNQLWEWWLKVRTNNQDEAVIDEHRAKDLENYKDLMFRAFCEAYRVLKPNRWITIEFHNSKNSIWNAIQESLSRAGFVVSDVRVLDKKLMTYKQSQQNLVKVDLIISAYKPQDRIIKECLTSSGTTAAWHFIEEHLKNLPVFVKKGESLEIIAERQPHMLYDRMLAFHISRSLLIPLSSAEFYKGLVEKYTERDSMIFLPEQVHKYDKARSKISSVEQLEFFVNDESSAIRWLRTQLIEKPQSFADIQPLFMKYVTSWKKSEIRLELIELLNENFICFSGNHDVPSQIHSYLSTQFKDLRNLSKNDPLLKDRAKDRWYVPDPAKAIDVETMRNKRLLQEFWELCEEAGIRRPMAGSQAQQSLPNLAASLPKSSGGKKIKEVRTEAVRLGFKECFAARDYATILAISAKLPENVIEEDEQLQMIHDMAEMRSQG